MDPALRDAEVRRTADLAWTLALVAALWLASDAGYFFLLPALGLKGSYSASSISIGVYYVFWVVNAFTLLMPEVSTGAMQTYLDKLSAKIADDEHLVALDQAGWHGANDLKPPANITLLPLPPRSPEPNPVERLRLYLKERYLSHHLLEDHDAIVDAACRAWQRLTEDTGRITSLCSYPWITDCVTS